jgi:hypothetical protein
MFFDSQHTDVADHLAEPRLLLLQRLDGHDARHGRDVLITEMHATLFAREAEALKYAID